jgi:integrase
MRKMGSRGQAMRDEKNLKRDKEGRWKIDFRCKGRRIIRVIGPSKREAEAEIVRLKGEILRDPYGYGQKRVEVYFEDHAKEFLELYCKQSKRSWARDETSLDHLKEFFKGKYLSEITAEQVERYKAKRRADLVRPEAEEKPGVDPKLVSPSTINRELACLKTCLNHAVEWEKLDRNPAAKVKKFREPNAKERILTPVEAKRLLGEASEDLRPVLIIALNTGMRKNEILSLRWKDVDFVKSFIHIADSKSGRSRDIPMNSLVFETLYEMSRDREFVFENPETKSQVLDVKTAFKGACRRAEIKGVRFHDLRHTAASRMVEAGIDLVTVSKILGHSSIQMTMRYAHPTPENMRLAVQKLGEVFEKSGKKPESVQVWVPVTASKTAH